MKNGANRLQYWDIAKGIVIILVVLGHVKGLNSNIRNAIFSFHMPFFFIANAFFVKNYHIRECIKKSSKSLLVPYAVVCLSAAVICVNSYTGEIPAYWIFIERIQDMVVGMSFTSRRFTQFDSVGMVWFVICLFATKVIYLIIMRFLEKTHIVVSFLVVSLLAILSMEVLKGYAYLPWSLDVALVALPFMWFGDQLKRRKWIDKLNVLVFLCSLILWFSYAAFGYHLEMATRSYPGSYLCIVEAVAGSILCIGVSQLLEKKWCRLSVFFAWCGKNSMIILAIHCLEARFFPWNSSVFSKIPFHTNTIMLFMIEMIAILIVTWIIVKIQCCVEYINNYETVRSDTV